MVILSGQAVLAALNATNSAIYHRRLSKDPVLPDIPAWLELAALLEQAVMAEAGHDRCLKVLGAEQLTAAEVAGELRKSQRTVRRLAETGRLAGRKTRNGWLFDPQTIVEFQKGADEKRAA